MTTPADFETDAPGSRYTRSGASGSPPRRPATARSSRSPRGIMINISPFPKYQGFDPAALTPEELEMCRGSFDEATKRSHLHRTHNVSQRSDPSLIATAYFCSPGTGCSFISPTLGPDLPSTPQKLEDRLR
jgi:hypothetical protein